MVLIMKLYVHLPTETSACLDRNLLQDPLVFTLPYTDRAMLVQADTSGVQDRGRKYSICNGGQAMCVKLAWLRLSRVNGTRGILHAVGQE